MRIATVFTVMLLTPLFGSRSAAAEMLQLGLGKVDVTPDRPVRLSGYGNRTVPYEAIVQKLWSRALAIHSEEGDLYVLANADTIGFPGSLGTAIAKRIEERFGVPRDRFVLCSTHSHTAPQLTGGLTNILAEPLTEREQKETARYTARLADGVVEAVAAAIADLAPGKLSTGEGKASVAVNRRVVRDGRWTGFGVQKDGPTDPALPVLKIEGADGKLRGVVFNYACHCTTLGSDFNQVCGDWAGYAQDYLEDRHRGCIAISTIGCGADANPEPRGKLEMAKANGRAIALAVESVLKGRMDPLATAPTTSFGYAGLPIDRPSTKELTERLESGNIQTRRHAETMLAIQKRMGRLPETYPAPIQTWRFGNALTMIFMGGEVVVDYALRLKREIEPGLVWVTAYANDVYGYLASERLRNEGGYEVDFSMIFYDQPGRWSSGTEELVLRRIHELLKESGTDGPLGPKEALRSFRVPDGFEVELVAAEPLVADPVAIAFDPSGMIWVAEMADYPLGIDGNGTPGGRIRILEDPNGDGRFKRSTVFLDGIPFPNGVMPWRKGVLVSAAPEIFYAEDTDGDRKADVRQVLFNGFAEANQQHRVHGFCYGLDNWVHIGGDNSGVIHSVKTGRMVDMSGRDARIRPDEGILELVSGRSQFGRNRDDWGHWFGNNNSLPLSHFVIEDRYLRRNPYVAVATPRVELLDPPRNPPIFPASRTVDRFNDLGTANRFTSACSPTIYRDTRIGPESSSTAFVCEPVHNLVHRIKLVPQGATYRGERFPEDRESEFLASTDPWSRPVHVTTGPDGAVWVTDMYRHVIEHPQWIPEHWQQRLDLRAGEDKGRIYRIRRKGTRREKLPTLAGKSAGELVATLESDNGWQRDTAQRLLVERGAEEAVEPLRRLAIEGARPTARLHALCTLDGMKALDESLLRKALTDRDLRVRAHAIRLSEPFLAKGEVSVADIVGSGGRRDAALSIVPADDLQAALSLGEANDPAAGEALGKLAVEYADDEWVRSAILTSAVRYPDRTLAYVLAHSDDSPARSGLIESLIASAVGSEAESDPNRILAAILPAEAGPIVDWRFSALAALFDGLDRRKTNPTAWLRTDGPEANRLMDRLRRTLEAAHSLALDPEASIPRRRLGIRLLALGVDDRGNGAATLSELLGPRNPPEVQMATVTALGKARGADVPEILLASWSSHVPRLRGAALDVLSSRPEWTRALLDALADRSVPVIDLDAARREFLLRHTDAAIGKRAQKLLGDTASTSRQAVMNKYASALGLTGNRLRGMAVFRRVCATCHRYREVGTQLAPELASLKDRSPEALLVAVLDPSRAVESKYRQYVAATSDGRVLGGMIVGETASGITLATVDGKRESILRLDIEELTSSGKSFMPEGLEKDLTATDLADVIAFVRSATGSQGGPEPNTEDAARLELVKGGVQKPLKVVAGLQPYRQASWLGTRSLRYCRQSDGHSSVAWTMMPKRGADGSQPIVFRLPAGMGYFSAPAGTFTLEANGQPLLTFAGDRTDSAWTSEDGAVTLHFLAMTNNATDATGVLSIEMPADRVRAGTAMRFRVTGSATESLRWFGVLLPEQRSQRRRRR